MAVDALAPRVARPSAAMILTTHNKQVLVFHGGDYNYLCCPINDRKCEYGFILLQNNSAPDGSAILDVRSLFIRLSLLWYIRCCFCCLGLYIYVYMWQRDQYSKYHKFWWDFVGHFEWYILQIILQFLHSVKSPPIPIIASHYIGNNPLSKTVLA